MIYVWIFFFSVSEDGSFTIFYILRNIHGDSSPRGLYDDHYSILFPLMRSMHLILFQTGHPPWPNAMCVVFSAVRTRTYSRGRNAECSVNVFCWAFVKFISRNKLIIHSTNMEEFSKIYNQFWTPKNILTGIYYTEKCWNAIFENKT